MKRGTVKKQKINSHSMGEEGKKSLFQTTNAVSQKSKEKLFSIKWVKEKENELACDL